MGLLFALESNRLVSIEKTQWIQVQKLDIPDGGLEVWLRDFGQVKLFRTWLKDEPRHYVVHLTDVTQLSSFNRKSFCDVHDQHWKTEQYHRVIKQVCNMNIFKRDENFLF